MFSSSETQDPNSVKRAHPRSFRSTSWIGVVTVCVLAVLAAQSLSAAEVPAEVKAFFEKHCLECHDQQSKKGGLDLTTQPLELSDAPTFLRWVRLQHRHHARTRLCVRQNTTTSTKR